MKQWHSTRQRTSSLSTTRSPSSSSLARTTEWVKGACWEPAGECVWAYACIALYCKDCINRPCELAESFTLWRQSQNIKTSLLPLFTASVPALPGASVPGRRLPLCSALSGTRPTGGSDGWTSGAARIECRPHHYPALIMAIIQCYQHKHQQKSHEIKQSAQLHLNWSEHFMVFLTFCHSYTIWVALFQIKHA